MNEQVKLAKNEEQPIRKYRTVFTSTKGLFRKKRWVILDIDEHGLTYRSEPNHAGAMFSSMYLVIDEIIIDERNFIITIKMNHEDYAVDLIRLDGDLWTNFNIIKERMFKFAEDKLIIKRQEWIAKKLSEELTKALREKVDKEIDAIVWLNKQGGVEFEVTYTGYTVETEICSGFLSNRGEVEFYRKSSSLWRVITCLFCWENNKNK